jgi:hypothetical protein
VLISVTESVHGVNASSLFLLFLHTITLWNQDLTDTNRHIRNEVTNEYGVQLVLKLLLLQSYGPTCNSWQQQCSLLFLAIKKGANTTGTAHPLSATSRVLIFIAWYFTVRYELPI